MSPAAQLPEGFLVGHWTDDVGRTGCTVVLSPDGAVGGVDVRGAASSTLATDSLRPGSLVEHVHGVLLTGGSAFGLEAGGGVMRYLEQHEIGYELVSVRVPIVAGAVIFDLPSGDPHARPNAEAGYAACVAATAAPACGAVGAGTGATVAKGGDASQTRPGGVGIATARVGEATVAAVMVVNSVGGIWDDRRQEWVAEFTSWDRVSGCCGRRQHDDRCGADRRGAHPRPGQSAGHRRPRRDRASDPALAHDVRRRHYLLPGDGRRGGAL